MSIREERKQHSRQALLNAALLLSTSGRSFSGISLREVTRQVGMVPTAFYRHFRDLDELGLELVDQAALHIKRMLMPLSQSEAIHSQISIEHIFTLFLRAVEQHPEQWIFFVGERWGGTAVLRAAIEREIRFLVDDLVFILGRFVKLQHLHTTANLDVLATLLVENSFHWAMRWIAFQRETHSVTLQQQHDFKAHAILQIQFMFRGILH